MKLTLIHNADVFTPEHKGKIDLLFCEKFILKMGKLNHKALAQSTLTVEFVDAQGKILIPGLIDPHQHLLGGSGENGGFSTQTPEIDLCEIIRAGITTVVGTLGVDTTMKTMPGLLAKVKGLNEEGLESYLYTGGYSIPPATIMQGPRQDIMFISECIGVGEIAIADYRSDEPSAKELARVVVESYLGGMLANKAGISHFHVGEGIRKMTCLKNLLNYSPEIKPEWLYPTHIERSPDLIKVAIEFAKKGSFVDIDTAEGGLHKYLKTYNDHFGSLKQLTISSDASKTSPSNVFKEIRNCVLHHRYKLESLLPLVTTNTAKVLKLQKLGELKVGNYANLVMLDRNSLEICDVYSQGKPMLKEGKNIYREKFEQESNRHIEFVGADFRPSQDELTRRH